MIVGAAFLVLVRGEMAPGHCRQLSYPARNARLGGRIKTLGASNLEPAGCDRTERPGHDHIALMRPYVGHGTRLRPCMPPLQGAVGDSRLRSKKRRAEIEGGSPGGYGWGAEHY